LSHKLVVGRPEHKPKLWMLKRELPWFKNQVYAHFGDQYCTAPFSGHVNTVELRFHDLAICLFCNCDAMGIGGVEVAVE
jgi:hypothetical protein